MKTSEVEELYNLYLSAVNYVLMGYKDGMAPKPHSIKESLAVAIGLSDARESLDVLSMFELEKAIGEALGHDVGPSPPDQDYIKEPHF